MIENNIREIEQRICAACERSGRSREEVSLIAVSKTKPLPMLNEAYRCGCREFGENRVQELKEKAELLPPDINWHMIGHLQKNKIRNAVKYASLIHSVDQRELAELIDREAGLQNKVMPILVEINIAQEASKFGLSADEALDFVKDISTFNHIKIKGLMTIAPYTELSVSNRIYFQKMKQLFIDIRSKNIDNIDMEILSMGMSGDFETAIEEGATMVRVGTSIFGER